MPMSCLKNLNYKQDSMFQDDVCMSWNKLVFLLLYLLLGLKVKQIKNNIYISVPVYFKCCIPYEILSHEIMVVFRRQLY